MLKVSEDTLRTFRKTEMKLLIVQIYTFIVTKQLNIILTYVLFYISTFGFYHRLNSSPKATASFDQVVFIYVLHCSGYCFH